MKQRMAGVVCAAALGVAGFGLPALAVRMGSRGRVLSREEALATLPGTLPRTALVLGAEVWPNGNPSPYLRGRLELAAELYRARLVGHLLVSGAGGEEHNHEAAAMRRHLEGLGIAPEAITEDPGGLDTYDSCLRARDVFGCDALTIVSQAFHVPRAVVICRVLGVRAIGVGDESARDRQWLRFQLRELGANLKMLLDLGTRRDPVHS